MSSHVTTSHVNMLGNINVITLGYMLGKILGNTLGNTLDNKLGNLLGNLNVIITTY